MTTTVNKVKYWEVSTDKGAMAVPDRHAGIAEPAVYKTQNRKFEPEAWLGVSLESLLYEMSTEANANNAAAVDDSPHKPGGWRFWPSLRK